MQRVCLLFLLLLTFSISAFSQNSTVKGRVINDQTGLPIENATIYEKGHPHQIFTDTSGQFTLKTIGKKPVLVLTVVGFKKKEVPADFEKNMVIKLLPDLSKLDEVVVTAMGVKKEVKTLGYAAEQISGQVLQEGQQSNVINALQGKVAGVSIASAGGGPGQGASIMIRGVNSLDPSKDNQPLFVIDGMPVDNTTSDQGTDGNRATVMPNRMADINPEDIQSVNILRGGAATALYGLRGANGVVVITTKSAQAGNMVVHYNASYSIDDINKRPALQLKYTQGWDGVYDSTSFWPAWGPTVEEARKEDSTHPASLYNNWKRAYNTGHQARTSISMSGGTDKANINTSLSYSKQTGMIPYTWYQDITAKIYGQLKLSEKFKIGSSLNFTNTDGNFYDADRYNEELIYWAPRWDVRDFIKPDGTEKTYGNTDPLWYAYTNKFESKVNRLIGNINLTYTITPWLTANYMLGVDTYGDARTGTAPGPKGVTNEIVAEDNGTGFVHEYHYDYRQLNSNVSFLFTHDWSSKLQTTFRIGQDVLDRAIKKTAAEGSDLDIYDLFTLNNCSTVSISESVQNYRIIGFYGDMTVGYNNFLFLTLTDRNDFSSSLNKHSFNYPSASLSYIFSQQIKMPSWVSSGKLRMSFAKIGKDAPAYKTSTYYTSAFSSPINGVNGWTRSDVAGSDIKPEKTTSIEVGTDLSFLDNRANLNLTLYRSDSKDQIIPVSLSATTGYSEIYMNAGEIRNRGIEISAGGMPVKTGDFSWNVNLTFSANSNKIIAIKDGMDEIDLGTAYGYSNATVTMKYVKGQSAGDIYGTPVSRYNDDANSLRSNKKLPDLIGSNGFPVLTSSSTQKIMGNSYPKWIGSVSNTLKYKGFSLYLMVDMQQNFQKYDQFSNYLAAFGESKITQNRNDIVTFKGVTSDGSANTKAVWLGQGTGPDGVNYGTAGYYRAVYRGISEHFVEDASWIRLRTASLSWQLPATMLSRKGSPIKSLNVSVTGNNLLLITKYKGFDPESSSSPSGSNETGFSGFSYPAMRSFVFSVNVGF